MNFTLAEARQLLLDENLLKEYITPAGWHLDEEHLPELDFTKLSYDSRDVDSETLFFCKGLNFKEAYLQGAIAQGLQVYVSEDPYEVTAACALIVTDIRKALAVLSMAFYEYPQHKLKIVAFTGTKGKTTAAYFTHSILQATTGNKAALLSTMNTTLDGENFFKSHLTTPESLDLYRMMAEAAANGMTHLVMEVSSQAYKVQRVYGLYFDVGVFLNISPDHISPIEHPTFDDYFYSKRQLLKNSRRMIINQESDYFDLLEENCQLLNSHLFTYGRQGGDYRIETDPGNSHRFHLTNEADPLKINGDYEIQLAGGFNQENAASALMAAALVGAHGKTAASGLASARVPGRMDQLTNKNGAAVYVDYAHNYLSLKTLLQFAKEEHPGGRVIVVLGSPGGKALSRRQDFGKVLSECADVAFLTADDPAFEDPQVIAKTIAENIQPNTVEVHFEMDREKAIQLALDHSQPEDSIVIAGKGVDLYQKISGVDVPYEGDYAIAKKLTES